MFINKVALCASLMAGIAIQGSEQEALMLQDLNPVAIHIASQNNKPVRPDPVQLSQILTESAPRIPREVNNIILQYARWEQSEESYESDSQLNNAYRELQKAQALSVFNTIGGISEFVIAWRKMRGNDTFDLQPTGSWEVPLVSIVFGGSLLASCFDCCRNLRRRETYEVGKWGSRFLSSIVVTAVPLMLMIDFVSEDDPRVYLPLLMAGAVGSVYSLFLLRHSRVLKRRLVQSLQLKELRDKL